jgi:hypothetical protein
MFYNIQGEYINKHNSIELFSNTEVMSESAIKPELKMNKSIAEMNELTISMNQPNSCDNLIKQSYADFDKKYNLLKEDYDKKMKEQKNLTDNTLKQFLEEKEAWNKKHEESKKEFDRLIADEKKKLNDLKTMFEDKINLLDSNIKDISLTIKKI